MSYPNNIREWEQRSKSVRSAFNTIISEMLSRILESIVGQNLYLEKGSYFMIGRSSSRHIIFAFII